MFASRAGHTATVVSGGEVLIAGGATISTQCVGNTAVTTVQPLASAELFDPASNSFAHTGKMNTARALHSATSLGNGKVLIVGGTDDNVNTLATAEIFQ
ncbi:MAG: hypothetical protein JOY79_05365 [Acidobacteriaceae bacterium]|nr:hypothetical protein [Acidobacteriaceae bacterium]